MKLGMVVENAQLGVFVCDAHGMGLMTKVRIETKYMLEKTKPRL